MRVGDASAPPAAVALTDWVRTDLAGRIQRIGEPFAELFDVPPAEFEITRVPLGPVPDDATRTRVAVRPQELDPNGHLNNAVHLDWLDEAVSAIATDPVSTRLPRRYLVEYLAPLPPGAAVELAAWPEPGAWLVAMARADGVEAARARLILG
jgi:hypothetical protein